jgi:DNA polymerase-3 subunit alpha
VQQRHKPFQDLFDFCARLDTKKVNKRVFDALIKSGALDSLGHTRGWMLANLETALSRAEKLSLDETRGQADLFATFFEDTAPTERPEKEYTQNLRLLGEKETLGLYFSGHPLQEFAHELKTMQVIKYAEVKPAKKEQSKRFAGIITGIRSMQTKNGDRMAILTIDDEHDKFEVAVFPEAYQNNRELLIKDELVIIEAKVGLDHNGNTKIRAETLYTIEKSREQFAKKIKIHLEDKPDAHDKVQTLKEYLLLLEKGSCQISIELKTREGVIALKLDDKWSIKPTQEAVNQMKALLAGSSVLLEF